VLLGAVLIALCSAIAVPRTENGTTNNDAQRCTCILQFADGDSEHSAISTAPRSSGVSGRRGSGPTISRLQPIFYGAEQIGSSNAVERHFREIENQKRERGEKRCQIRLRTVCIAVKDRELSAKRSRCNAAAVSRSTGQTSAMPGQTTWQDRRKLAEHDCLSAVPARNNPARMRIAWGGIEEEAAVE